MDRRSVIPYFFLSFAFIVASCATPVRTTSRGNGPTIPNVSPAGQLLTLDRGDLFGIDVAFAVDGQTYISYYDLKREELKLHICDQASCESGTTRVLVDADTGAGVAEILIRPDGRPLLVYKRSTSRSTTELRIFDCDDARCEAGSDWALDTGYERPGFYMSMTVDADGRPVIAFQNFGRGGLAMFSCADMDCKSGTPRTLDDRSYSGLDAYMALRPDDRPIIAYVRHSSRRAGIYVYDCASPVCGAGEARRIENLNEDDGSDVDELESAPRSLLDTSIAASPTGFPVLAYRADYHILKTHACSDENCLTGTTTLHGEMNQVSAGTSIAIMSDGRALIAVVNEHKIGVFVCEDTACISGHFLPIADYTDIGVRARIYIGADGFPVIFFADEPNGTLNMFTCQYQDCRVGL